MNIAAKTIAADALTLKPIPASVVSHRPSALV
jgi:hypothetical protein